MLAIRININMRNIVLTGEEKEHLGVRLKDGEYRYLPWDGFMDIEKAKTLGKPVKCKLSAYTTDESLLYKVVIVTDQDSPIPVAGLATI